MEFQLDRSEIQQMKDFLLKKLKKVPFDPMKRSGKKVKVSKRAFDAPFHDDPSWQGWLEKIGYSADWDGRSEPEGALIPVFKMGKLYNVLYSITQDTWTARYINFVLDAIYSADPIQLGKDLFSLENPPNEMPVPTSMIAVADIGTGKGGSKGTEIGRGEFVVPLLFKDSKMGGANAVHDVNINGIGWHVKEITSNGQYIRLGLSTYAKSELSGLLQQKVGMSGGDLSVTAKSKPTYGATNNLYDSVTPGKISIVATLDEKYGNIDDGTDALLKLQEVLNEDMRSSGIGNGAGVLFYQSTSDILHFVPTDKCTCGGATQGAHTVGMAPTGPFERAAAKGAGE